METTRPEGFIIPDVFKNVSLTITSLISRPAVDILDAYNGQQYCNYLIESCISSRDFFSSVVGTSFDTELYSNSNLQFGRAFTLNDFKSITFEGLWFSNYRRYDDGGVIFAKNSKVAFKNCFFINNRALSEGRGSAIFSLNSDITIEGSVFFKPQLEG